MSKGLKIFLWILAIIVVLAILAFAVIIPWGKGVWDKITFSVPKPLALDLKGLTLDDLKKIALSGGSRQVILTLATDIKNENNFSITFSNIKLKILYKGDLIAETTDNSSYTVPANASITVTSAVNIILNGSGIKMLIEKAVTGKTSVDSETSVRVYGIPLPKISYTFNI